MNILFTGFKISYYEIDCNKQIRFSLNWSHIPRATHTHSLLRYDRHTHVYFSIKKVKWSRYRPGVAQRVGRGIVLLFHDRGSRRRWLVSSTPRPHFTHGKDPVPILQEAGWAPGPVWTGGKSRPHRDSIPHRPVRSQSLYRLSYPAHIFSYIPYLLA